MGKTGGPPTAGPTPKVAGRTESPDGPFLRSRSFWRLLGWCLTLALGCALGALAFVAVVNLGRDLLWPHGAGEVPFSGHWRTVAIMGGAGLVVGLVHRFLRTEEIDVFEAADRGRLDPRPVPGALLTSVVTLVGGFSLGPEVPTGMLAGGLSTWAADKRGSSADESHLLVQSGILGAWGGLFTSPFAALLMPLELTHRQSRGYFPKLLTLALAALAGFIVFYAVAGDRFADVIRLLDLPTYDLRVWHVLPALALGILGSAIGMLFGVSQLWLHRLLAPLRGRPVIRCTAVGVLLGLLGVALPLTLFLGTDGLVNVTRQPAAFGAAILVLTAFAKLFATAVALASGFVGGPIFPLFFVGGSFGLALNLVVPELPIGLAVGCLMAAIPAAIIPIPLALSMITVLIVGTPASDVVPIVLAALVSHAIATGLRSPGRPAPSPAACPERRSKAD